MRERKKERKRRRLLGDELFGVEDQSHGKLQGQVEGVGAGDGVVEELGKANVALVGARMAHSCVNKNDNLEHNESAGRRQQG